MSVQTIEQRIGELLRLRDKVDAELARLDRATAPGRRRSRFVIPDCGTESAYQRHRYRGEEQDDACKKAHAEHERIAGIRRRNEKRLNRRLKVA